jgi:hypothetical protein
MNESLYPRPLIQVFHNAKTKVMLAKGGQFSSIAIKFFKNINVGV